MNEAKKPYLARRPIRSLCGRWPSHCLEIEARMGGIDFAVFMGKAVVTSVSDDPHPARSSTESTLDEQKLFRWI